MRVETLFTEADLATIAEATRVAEARTSAEIVAYVVGQCDDYEEAAWKGAAFGALAASGAAGLLHLVGEFWGGHGVIWITAPTALGAVLGYLATLWSAPLRRSLISQAEREAHVRARAKVAFLDEEVFRTRDRTGILLFVGLFEHRVEVLADTGIHTKVPPSEWQAIAARLTEGVKTRRAAPAFVDAIHACARLLEERGFLRADADLNELGDSPRMRDS